MGFSLTHGLLTSTGVLGLKGLQGSFSKSPRAYERTYLLSRTRGERKLHPANPAKRAYAWRKETKPCKACKPSKACITAWAGVFARSSTG